MPYTVDLLGIKRDQAQWAVFEQEDELQVPQFGADVLVWTEYLHASYYYYFPGLVRPPLEVPAGMKPPPISYFVTTPNATWIPDVVGEDRAVVFLRTDGRFYTHDFMYWPQWYFPGTYYMPYIRKKPGPKELATHPYRIMWYDMRDSDFIQEPGSMIMGYGRLKESIAKELDAVRKALHVKLKAFYEERKFEEKDYREMLHCKDGMHYASVCLLVAPQSLLMTRSTVGLLQRNFFEALACYEYLTIWKPRTLSFENFPVDNAIVGAFTCDVLQVQEFFKIGVPVWYFRHPGTMRPAKICGPRVYPKVVEGCVSDKELASERIYNGPPSAARNRACQALRLQTIRLGHTAYESLPGDAGQGFPGRDEKTSSDALPLPDSAPSAVRAPISSKLTSISQRSATNAVAPGAVRLWPTLPPNQAQTFNVNHNKFLPPSSPLSPNISAVWLTALRNVNARTALILDHPDRTLFKGYALPDPAIFTSGDAKPDRVQKNMITWLLIRRAWITYTTSRTARTSDKEVCMPQPANWKTLLVKLATRFGLDRASPTASSSTAAVPAAGFAGRHGVPSRGGQPAAKVRKVQRSGKVDQYEIDESFTATLSPGLVDVMWDGEIVKNRDTLLAGNLTLPLWIVPEIVWELFEQNFRLELLALDRCIVSQKNWSVAERVAREDMVSAVFPDGLIIMYKLPLKDHGLGALAWQQRVEYVEAFRCLLALWPQSPSNALHSLSSELSTVSESQVLSVEASLYAFYCQTFFVYFGRAATVPAIRPIF